MNLVFSELELPLVLATSAPDIVFAIQSVVIIALVALSVWLVLRSGVQRPRGRGMAQQLHENQEQLALVIEGSRLGMWDRDLESGRTEFNARWAEMLGYTLDEIESSSDSWRKRLHPEDAPETLRRLQSHLDGETDHFEAEYRLKTKSGNWIWVHSVGRVSLRETDGTPLRMLGTNKDITAQRIRREECRQTDRQVLQSQKLESLGVLAGGIAHDFNNLLMGIMGNASLVGFTLADSDDAQQYLQDIDISARRAADLCHQLLAYSGRGQFAVEAIDLNTTVGEIQALMSATLSKKVTVDYQINDGVPPIEADASQLRQVIINLVTNAAEATEGANAKITVTTGLMECDEAFLATAFMSDNATPGAYGYVEITDSGFGMSHDTLLRAFEPFFSTKRSGRGLGLAAVLGIVRGHEGCIDIESAARQGTRVRVLFPTSGAAAAPANGPGHVGADAQLQGTIMVVDDESTVRTVAKNMLERIGFQVITAVDGRDAIRRFEELVSPVDCILLDLTMPHMDGEEAFDALYKKDPGVRVLISSGYSEEEIAHRFAGRQIAGFIKKPYDVEDLRDTMHRTLN